MNLRPFFSALVTLTLLLSFLPQHSRAADAAPAPVIKVMSFNIRYGTASDGTNSWPERRALLIDTIKTFAPDLLGTQEVLASQAAFLREQLPAYAFHGVGRDDGEAKGEFVPIMYRRDRFEEVDAGHFWLSETPDVPGSKNWDAALTRMLSWVVLQDKQGASGPFVFANTHFDHIGARAREASARLLRERATTVPPDYPIILCGDFNTGEGSPPYQVLTAKNPADGISFLDSFRVIHPQRTTNEASFNGWKTTRAGDRIDWILHTPQFITLDARINYTQSDGRYPSDHYPVEAVLRRRP